MGDNLPKEGEIYQGKVVKIESFGVFVDIEGFFSNGLVHISQLAKDRVEHPEDVVSTGQHVFVKVLTVDPPDDTRRRPKISLSMKYADQSTGADRDRNGIDLEQEQRRRRSYDDYQQAPVTLEAIYNTVCAKCNGKGHLASECFNVGGTTYDLIGDDEYDEMFNSGKDNESQVPPARAVGRGRGATLPSWMTEERLKGNDQNERGREKKRRKMRSYSRSRSRSHDGKSHKKKDSKKKSDKKHRYHKSKSSHSDRKTHKEKHEVKKSSHKHSRKRKKDSDHHRKSRSLSFSDSGRSGYRSCSSGS